ncbi:MAG: hypothetical protein QXT38_03870, partial [Candidatus Aenigmatarchaeota archaeon]
MRKLFLPIAEKLESFLSFLKDYMNKANMKINLVTYISIILFLTAITFISSIFFTTIILPYLIKSQMVLLFLTIFLPIIATISTFLIGIFYPINKAYSRNTQIENILPYVIIHLSSIVRSGIPP